jgi:NIMA-interacting peptidyl-prolyl cis-trans isomerase 1
LETAFSRLAECRSDCSSGKAGRGGDLGFFTKGKMQPPFEHASFALRVGELSGIVDTPSGLHVILRTA